MNQLFDNANKFELNILKRVWLGTKNLTTRWNLPWGLNNESDFESTLLPPIRFWIEKKIKKHQILRYKGLKIKICEKNVFKYSISWQCTPLNHQSCHFQDFLKTFHLRKIFSEKNPFWIKFFQKNQILIQLLYKSSSFESRSLKHVRLCTIFSKLVGVHIQTFTECQNWSRTLPPVRFWFKNFKTC